MRPTRGFNLEGENETAVVGEAVPAGQVSAAAAEAANQPILGHVRGANNRWIPEQPHGSSELGKEGTPRSRCDSLASWARRCVGRDAEGRLVIGCGGVTLPAMVTLHNATGAIENILRQIGAPQASNVFVTNDAATLLKDLHSLIVKARKDPTDPLTPLPFRGQRNYLLLEHSVL